MSKENSLSSDTDGLSTGPSGRSESGGRATMERVVDPDDYNLRRRLKQLHNAKEAVKRRKDDALELERVNRTFTADQRDRFIAEKLVDYIHELRPLLKKIDREEDFLAEEVGTVNSTTVTIQSIIDSRGYVSSGDTSRYSDNTESGGYIPYEATMAAWDICNDYFEDVAGAVFEESSPDPGANPVDPAGRFNQ